MICNRCNGSGLIHEKYHTGANSYIAGICWHCKGKPNIDWIENIFGVEKYDIPDKRIVEIFGRKI